jgi:hypothetical protein
VDALSDVETLEELLGMKKENGDFYHLIVDFLGSKKTAKLEAAIKRKNKAIKQKAIEDESDELELEEKKKKKDKKTVT